MSVCASVGCLERLRDVRLVELDITSRADRVGHDRGDFPLSGRGQGLELLHEAEVVGERTGRNVGRPACANGGRSPSPSNAHQRRRQHEGEPPEHACPAAETHVVSLWSWSAPLSEPPTDCVLPVCAGLYCSFVSSSRTIPRSLARCWAFPVNICS